MKCLPDEKIIAKHGFLFLTNKRLVKENKTQVSHQFEEIPLRKIDSIKYSYKHNIYLFIVGIICLALGFFISVSNDVGLNTPVIIIGVIGLILLIFWHFGREEIVCFGSSSMKITEESSGITPFIEKFHGEIYKK